LVILGNGDPVFSASPREDAAQAAVPFLKFGRAIGCGHAIEVGSTRSRRGMDSKFQFRDISPSPTACAPSSRRWVALLSDRRRSIGLRGRRPLGWYRRPTVDRPQSDRSPRNRCLSGAEL